MTWLARLEPPGYKFAMHVDNDAPNPIMAHRTALERWRDAWRARGFRLSLVGTLLGVGVTLAGFTMFLGYVEQRSGVVLMDPVLAAFHPVDVTWWVFAVLYLSLGTGIATLLRTPRELVIGVQTYLLMVAVRTVMMFVTPLDPPPTMIPLLDPVVAWLRELLGHRSAATSTPTRDLFFSGHTATMCVLGFTAQATGLRRFFFACAGIMATLVTVQHVHYTVDVLVAPFVAFAAHRCVLAWHGTHLVS
jgi:hypothetical protein